MDGFDDAMDSEDSEYVYPADAIKSILDKLTKKYNKELDPNFKPDMWLEDYTPYDYVMDVQRRNMDKFDALTDLGYKLDFATGQFKLSA